MVRISLNDVFFLYNCVCECTVGVDVGDGSTTVLFSILPNIVMRCIVLGKQINVYFGTIVCTNATTSVGMDVRFCTMKIHDSMVTCSQTIQSIVVHILQSFNLELFYLFRLFAAGEVDDPLYRSNLACCSWFIREVGGGNIIRWLSSYVLRNACAMSDI